MSGTKRERKKREDLVLDKKGTEEMHVGSSHGDNRLEMCLESKRHKREEKM